MNAFIAMSVSAIILFLAAILLVIRILFFKKGKFPTIHIGANEALKEKGYIVLLRKIEKHKSLKTL
ncbi:MAG: hypothetical protein QM751_02065 [Paludibacteraceae bacterium]